MRTLRHWEVESLFRVTQLVTDIKHLGIRIGASLMSPGPRTREWYREA